jgi:Uma2 family endonuclease
MATVPSTPVMHNGYPTTDGKPMAETDWHRDLMIDLIRTLKRRFAARRRVYVSGNMLVFYEPGDRRRHVSPYVFVVRGVANRQRPNYLIREEGHAPQVVIDLTSSSTRNEDQRTKFALYRDTLKVREYFLFDPQGDYLDPRLQGYRLRKGEYRPIRPVDGRLPSQVLRLHLEVHGNELRLYDPATGQVLPTPLEAQDQAEVAHHEAAAAREEAEVARDAAEAARRQAEQESERLRQEVAELRRRLGEQP